MEKEWVDEELGVVTLRVSARAKRYSIKIVNGRIVAVIPPGGNEQRAREFIEENRKKLAGFLKKHPAQHTVFDDSIELQTNTFRLNILRTERSNFYMTLNNGMLTIACPQDTDFQENRVQDMLKGALEKALRHEAKRILPGRLKTLASQHDFTYSSIKINKSKTRWGSCSAKGSINLSLSLMLLPDHLIDYVLLHELCHTKEMNHSSRFWQLMDKVTDGQALQLRKELKKNRML